MTALLRAAVVADAGRPAVPGVQTAPVASHDTHAGTASAAARDAHAAAGAAHDTNTPHYVAPEHEFEAAPGLPEPLPRGEHVLWQGAPRWRVLAREAMHTRLLAIYFALLLGARAVSTLASGGSVLDAGEAVLALLPLALLALGALSLMGWLVARTTVYTVTDKRVVMRIGVVLTITFNLPLSQIESAGLRSNADGTGDLTLALAGSDRIAYAHLWPHARPWHVKRTQPMLRALPEAGRVAAILAAALTESSAAAGTVVAPLPAASSVAPAGLPARPAHAAAAASRSAPGHGANEGGSRQPLAA